MTMRPLAAISAPILAALYVERARVTDDTTAELRRLTDETNATIDRLKAAHPPKPEPRKVTA
jgi:hypothetical protein